MRVAKINTIQEGVVFYFSINDNDILTSITIYAILSWRDYPKRNAKEIKGFLPRISVAAKNLLEMNGT